MTALAGHTNSYHPYTAEEAYAGLAEAGYRAVELSAVPGWTEHVDVRTDPLEVRAQLERHGLEALRYLKGSDRLPSVILLDLMMPVMDGPTTIKELRSINPKVRIIATSGLIENDNIADVANPEVDQAFIPKPYTAEVLLKTVQSFLI